MDVTGRRGRLLRVLKPLLSLAERALGLRALDRVQATARASMIDGDLDSFLATAVGELGVAGAIPREDLDRIPRSGPLLVVANHPHGILDGLLLAVLLRMVRKDVKILGNHLLARIPELADLIVGVDPFGGRSAHTNNLSPLRAAISWLQEGGVLLMFPAGEVSARTWRHRRVQDKAWSQTLAALQRRTQANVLPIWIDGQNSRLFQGVGLIHPRLRTLLLVRELLRKRNSTVPIKVGNMVPATQLTRFDTARELVSYLRLRCEILGRRSTTATRTSILPRPGLGLLRRRIADEDIISAVSPDLLARDVADLPSDCKLHEQGDLEVYGAFAPQLPHVLQEIGRLREITFRKAGEGTGRSLDLDRFDAHYLHLFVWNRAEREIVGAYRLGRTDDLLFAHGVEGLYTSTLYRFDERFLSTISPALELGRSFIVPEYQREFLPLLLLWLGIGTYVARNPRYKTLFGPVSISDRHHAISKQMILDHLRAHCMADELVPLLEPRNPAGRTVHRRLCGWTDAMLEDLNDVSAMVSELETELRGVPVLLREYLKLGGRMVAINIDPDFRDAIDALVVVDLTRTDVRLLRRYLGKDGARQFLAWHGVEAAT